MHSSLYFVHIVRVMGSGAQGWPISRLTHAALVGPSVPHGRVRHRHTVRCRHERPGVARVVPRVLRLGEVGDPSLEAAVVQLVWNEEM